MKRIALVALLVLAIGPVAGVDYKPISGSYAIAGPTLVDAPPEEARDRVILFLEKDVARDLYQGMSVSAQPEECLPARLLTKHAGGLTCTLDTNDESYMCWIGVRLDSGSAVQVNVPC